jgi:streptogramin lyase
VAHDVFISYAHHDKPHADAVCATLEAKGIRCWVAPRDVIPGQEWGEAIVDAIHSSRVMVLMFSSHANDSPQIRREVQLAVNAESILIPFRIEDVAPARSLEYFLGTPHWLDAMTPPLEAHLERLAVAVRNFLAVSTPATPEAADVASPTPARANVVSTPPTPSDSNVVTASAAPAQTEVSAARPASVKLPLSAFEIYGVAVDTAGTVYVTRETMFGSPLCMKLPVGAAEPAELPFVGLSKPKGVAVDLAGNVYVADEAAKAVFKLEDGAHAQDVLPFDDLSKPVDVAVDSGGAVYVADKGYGQVLKLAPGADAPIKLSFADLTDVSAVAVDNAGHVYVADTGNKRVLKLAENEGTPTVLPFTKLKKPCGVAVDDAGAVYVVDAAAGSRDLLKLSPGRVVPLRFPVNDPGRAVTTDRHGNVYVVIGAGRNHVLKLPTA